MAIACKHCGCKHNRVTNTYANEVRFKGVTSNRIRRRRVCMNCGLPFYTTESYEAETEGPLPEPKPPDRPPQNPYI